MSAASIEAYGDERMLGSQLANSFYEIFETGLLGKTEFESIILSHHTLHIGVSGG